jgi:hypothetical protein
MYIQYGCGLSAPREWTDFDASMTLKWERLPFLGKLTTKNAERFPENVKPRDIVKGLPVRDGLCRGVYASHVLEHSRSGVGRARISGNSMRAICRPTGFSSRRSVSAKRTGPAVCSALSFTSLQGQRTAGCGTVCRFRALLRITASGASGHARTATVKTPCSASWKIPRDSSTQPPWKPAYNHPFIPAH